MLAVLRLVTLSLSRRTLAYSESAYSLPPTKTRDAAIFVSPHCARNSTKYQPFGSAGT